MSDTDNTNNTSTDNNAGGNNNSSTDDTSNNGLGDAGLAALQSERDARKAAEKSLRDLQTKSATDLSELQKKYDTDVLKLQTDLEAAKTEISTFKLNGARTAAAIAAGLPSEAHDLITGNTEEEIKASVTKITNLLGLQGSDSENGNGGRRPNTALGNNNDKTVQSNSSAFGQFIRSQLN